MTTTEYNDLRTALAHLNSIDLEAVDRHTEDAVEAASNLVAECMVEQPVKQSSPSSRTHWHGAGGWIRFEDMEDLYVYNTYNYLLRRGEMSAGISVEFFSRSLCDRQAEMKDPNNLYRLEITTMTIADIRKASHTFEEPVSVLDEAEQVQLLKWHQSRWPGELDSLAGCTVGVAMGANKLNSLLWCGGFYWFLNDIWDLA